MQLQASASFQNSASMSGYELYSAHDLQADARPAIRRGEMTGHVTM